MKSPVEAGEERVALPEPVRPGVELYLPGLVAQVREAGLSVVPERDHPPGDGHGAGLLEQVITRGVKAESELACPMGDSETLPERVDPAGAQRFKLLDATPNEVICLRLGCLRQWCFWLRGGHARPTFPR